jgi:hypothetical protein
MNKKSKVSLIMICLLLALMSVSLSSCAKRAEASNPVTYTGIVTDVHCYLKKPDITLDSKKCLQMPACAATGYGIVILKDDKTTDFYFLDGDFAPNATGAQLTVAKLIDASTKTDHFYFTVTGTLSGETKKIAYEKTYKVLNVTSIVESNGN